MNADLDRAISAHHPLGASTGFFKQWRGLWDELLRRALAISSFAVELAALSEAEFGGLLAFLRNGPHLPFTYLSVHAPVKGREAPDQALVEWLRDLPPTVETIVIHPDTLTALDAYRVLGRRLVLENMDLRKASGRTADELAAVFEQLPEAGFCLDIAHAWSIDPTMRVANELLDRFGDRLRQVHLSSLLEGKHVPVSADQETAFRPVLERCLDVPWILEAEMPARWADAQWVRRDAARREHESIS